MGRRVSVRPTGTFHQPSPPSRLTCTSQEEIEDETRGTGLDRVRDFAPRGRLRRPRGSVRCRAVERLALADAPPPDPGRTVRAPARSDRVRAAGLEPRE